MFSNEVTNAVIAAASAHAIRPAALLALIQVETAGHSFEVDGKTPTLLFERHVCYREAQKAGCLAPFVNAGLAIPHWNRATQYRDEATSQERIALIEKARAINVEIANRSASWGIGQTMGFNAPSLGYASATAMIEDFKTLDGQIDGLIRELTVNHIVKPLNDGDYKTVARLYNGPGYAQNHYDTRLAEAEAQWHRELAANPVRPAVAAEQHPAPPAARIDVAAHKQLTANLGFFERVAALFNH